MFRSPMTLDSFALATTLAVGAVVVIVAISVLRGAPGLPAGVTAVVLLSVLAVTWAWSPRELVIDDAELLVIRRAGPPLRIPLSTVAQAVALERIGAGTVRVWGVGGFFGNYGLFRNHTLGRFRAYATRRGPVMVVRRNDGELPIVLTPDDVDRAVSAIEQSRGERPVPIIR